MVIDSSDNKTINQEQSPTQEQTTSINNDTYRQAYIINDADGWTNIRTSPSSKSAIVDKVYEGSIFYISHIPGSKWCEFYWDINGPIVGYIHSKYIKPQGSSKSPPNQYKTSQSAGKFHIIVSAHKTYYDAQIMQRRLNNGDSGFYANIIYSPSQNTYRISVYSSYSKSDAKQQLQYVQDYWPNAWITSE